MENLSANLKKLESSVKSIRAVNVNSSTTKQLAIDTGTIYFEQTRGKIISDFGETAETINQDKLWQKLITLAQKNNSKSSYIKIIKEIKNSLAKLRVEAVVSNGNKKINVQEQSDDERLLIITLEQLVPTAAISYKQGLLDLQQPNRISYRGTAVEFREALREILDHLAPDKDVEAQAGFKHEGDRKQPTQKQKVRYVLTSRGRSKNQRDTLETSASLVDEKLGELTRNLYTQASVATHVSATREEARKIKRYVDTVLFDLLELHGSI